MKYSKDKYFSCYSPNLTKFLTEKGFKILVTFVHVKTTKTYWVFERTDGLSSHLIFWTKNKQKEHK